MMNQCPYLINKMINVCPKKEIPDSTVLQRLKRLDFLDYKR